MMLNIDLKASKLAVENPVDAALEYAEGHFRQTVRDLIALTKIPSVSFPGYDKKHVEASAEATLALMKAAGLEHCELLRLPGVNPAVYGDWLHAGKNAPTVLLYAHHDVQPPMREELWNSPPFEPTQRGDRLFARGIADDKAGALLHAASVAAWLKTNGKLPVNVKVFIEGEEEIGSPNLEAFLKKFKQQLKSDVFVLADVANFETGVPSLTTSLRGLAVVEIEVAALDHPLHSGLWSGPLPDPAMAMSKVLASLTDAKGRIAVRGFYDDVAKPTAAEKRDMKKLEPSDKTLRRQSELLKGVDFLPAKGGHLERLWRQPSLVVNSMVAGDRKSAGNVILDKAWARVGIRLAPGQNPTRAMKKLKDHLKKNTPWGAKLTIVHESASPAWTTSTDHPAFALTADAMTKGYGKKTVYVGCGASIPFVHAFESCFPGAPALLVGVEDPYTNAHSENESLHLGDFAKAVDSQIRMFDALKGLGK